MTHGEIETFIAELQTLIERTERARSVEELQLVHADSDVFIKKYSPKTLAAYLTAEQMLRIDSLYDRLMIAEVKLSILTRCQKLLGR